MKKTEIVKFLWEISWKLQNECNWKWFVSSQLIMETVHKIEDFELQLDDDVIEIENYTENKIQFCGACNQKISKRRRRIEKSMITWLLKAIYHCRKNNLKTFHKRDIENLTSVEYVLMPFLPKFWLLYKSDEMIPWEFWIPFKICSEFFNWTRSVMEFYEIDPTKKKTDKEYKTNSEKRIFLKDIPDHKKIVENYPNTIEYIINNI